MEGTSKGADKSRRSLLKELPYFSCSGSLSMFHGQFNNSFVIPWKTRRDLDKLASIYDLDLFTLNTSIDHNLSPVGHSNMQIHSRYFLPHSFRELKTKQLKDEMQLSFSVFHNNVSSLNRNLKNLQLIFYRSLIFTSMLLVSPRQKLPIPMFSPAMQIFLAMFSNMFPHL